MDQIFFDNWSGVFRVAITTIIAYALVVLMLRISGKRTLAKMNAFDTVVTIALGSILGSIILSKNTPVAEGITAIGLLIFLQYIITFITVRNNCFKKIISSDPSLLFYDGSMLKKNLKQERISVEEVNKSVREAGYSSFESVEAIVLESTGDITVIIKRDNSVKANAMKDVQINF